MVVRNVFPIGKPDTPTSPPPAATSEVVLLADTPELRNLPLRAANDDATLISADVLPTEPLHPLPTEHAVIVATGPSKWWQPMAGVVMLSLGAWQLVLPRRQTAVRENALSASTRSKPE